MSGDDNDDAFGMDGVDDVTAWPYQPPTRQPGHERLTLALLEDLCRVLIVHGYPPLRGRALTELAISLQRIDDVST